MRYSQYFFYERLMFAAISVIQFAVFANPNAELTQSYHAAYSIWRMLGSDADWTLRLGVVAFLAVGALFTFPDPRFTKLVRLCAAWMQFGTFCAIGLMFGLTNPPQTGLCYIAPGLYCAWMGWAAYRDEP